MRRAIAELPPPGSTPNPYAELLYGELEELGLTRRPLARLDLRALWRARRTHAILHFNWRPDRYYAPSLAADPLSRRRLRPAAELLRFALLLRAARRLGYRIAWTVHDTYPTRQGPARRRIDRLGQSLLANACTVVIAHDPAIAERAREVVVGRCPRIEVVPHGTFSGVYPPCSTGERARRRLGIPADAFVFLCFGQLRADKQVRLLLDAFARLRSPDVRLVVVGAAADDSAGELVLERAGRDPRIRALLEIVPHELVPELFAMSDAFVLARSEPWSSGSLILALSLGLPVVAARLDANESLLGGTDAAWLFTPGDVDSLHRALELAAVSRESAAMKGAQARLAAERLPSWREVALRVAALLQAA